MNQRLSKDALPRRVAIIVPQRIFMENAPKEKHDGR
jgi:hypothetical protein